MNKYIAGFLAQLASNPKKAAEMGGYTGLLTGFVSYWNHFYSTVWGTFVIGLISTIIFAIAGAAASFLTQRYMKKKFKE